MEITKKKISQMYKKEKSNLLLEFDGHRYAAYVDIINRTPEYRDILDQIPHDLSNIEKSYFVYSRLANLLYENNDLVYNHIKNLGIYYDVIQDNGVGNCRQMSELLVSMLKHKQIIQGFHLARKPVGITDLELRHIDAILKIDDNLYMTDIIRDTVNLRAGIRTGKFGFYDSKQRRLEELKSGFLKFGSFPEETFENILSKVNSADYISALADIQEYEKTHQSNDFTAFLRNKLPKIEYIDKITNHIGTPTFIPISSDDPNAITIESLDKKLGNRNHFVYPNPPFVFESTDYLYLEDIISSELLPQLVNKESSLRINWNSNNDANNSKVNDSFDSNLELDMDIILEFFGTMAPKMDPELYLKYIRQIVNNINRKRYSDSLPFSKNWANKNIKLHKAISQDNIGLPDRNASLETILVIRKHRPEDDDSDQKYMFYEFSDQDKFFAKKSYQDMMNSIKTKKMKICPKFSRNISDSSDELEI